MKKNIKFLNVSLKVVEFFTAVLFGSAILFSATNVLAQASCSTSAASQPVCEGGGGVWDNNRDFCSCPGSTGTLGQYCDDSTHISCITGLNCVENKCTNPNAPAGGSPGTGSPGTGGPSGGGTMTCPPGLAPLNGICLPPPTCTGGISCTTSLTDLIFKVIAALLAFAGVVSVLILIVGGFWYITSAGNEEQAEKGKKAIINAIIGLAVVILAYAIVAVLGSLLNGTDKLLQK